MANILVTGGAGFIGSHVCDALLARGDSVICVDNLNEYYSPEVKISNIRHNLDDPEFRFHVLDISDFDRLSEVFSGGRIDKVCHLAARAGVRPSIEKPRDYVRSNVVGTTNILELCRLHGIADVVIASSSSVYGKHDRSAFVETENTDLSLSPYAATKKSCEAIAHSYANASGLNISLLRFFTVYGPRNRPDMAMFTFSKAIMEGREIPVFGDDTRRDWTFISDIVDGVIRSLDTPRKYEIYNLGNCSPVPVTYVIELLEKELGKSALTRKEPLPAADVPITFADTSKAQRLLGWKATTSIEEGVRKFAEWFKQAQ